MLFSEIASVLPASRLSRESYKRRLTMIEVVAASAIDSTGYFWSRRPRDFHHVQLKFLPMLSRTCFSFVENCFCASVSVISVFEIYISVSHSWLCLVRCCGCDWRERGRIRHAGLDSLHINSCMDFDRLRRMFHISSRVDVDGVSLVRRIVTTPLNDKEDMFGCESNELLRKHKFFLQSQTSRGFIHASLDWSICSAGLMVAGPICIYWID